MKVLYLRSELKPKFDRNKADYSVVEQLFAEHSSALLRFIRVRSRLNESDCEDVRQEVYERLLKIDDLEQTLSGRLDTVRNYLFQIATNLLIDRDRRAKVRQSEAHVSESEVAVLCSLHSPERKQSNTVQLKQLQQALDELKTSHRQAFLLNRLEGKSYREISDILGVSVSTIEKYMSAALMVLRARMLMK